MLEINAAASVERTQLYVMHSTPASLEILTPSGKKSKAKILKLAFTLIEPPPVEPDCVRRIIYLFEATWTIVNLPSAQVG